MITPKEHPLIFSGESVRAILAGCKTMTRRVMSRRNSFVDGGMALPDEWMALGFDKARTDSGSWLTYDKGPYLHVPVDHTIASRIIPRVQPGDRIWVKEIWRECPRTSPREEPLVIYRADDKEDRVEWNSPIFMPRWACRLMLDVTAVRPERLHDISTEDCIAEGLSTTLREYDAECDLRNQYHRAWDAINAKHGFGFDTHCWVWVYTLTQRARRKED